MRVRPERLYAKHSQATKKSVNTGRSPDSKNFTTKKLSPYSGATARDSHPLPYSPSSVALGTLDAFG
jgi:hypothetical protein